MFHWNATGFVFERFRQADAGFTRKFGWPGLGLAIARHSGGSSD